MLHITDRVDILVLLKFSKQKIPHIVASLVIGMGVARILEPFFVQPKIMIKIAYESPSLLFQDFNFKRLVANKVRETLNADLSANRNSYREMSGRLDKGPETKAKPDSLPVSLNFYTARRYGQKFYADVVWESIDQSQASLVSAFDDFLNYSISKYNKDVKNSLEDYSRVERARLNDEMSKLGVITNKSQKENDVETLALLHDVDKKIGGGLAQRLRESRLDTLDVVEKVLFEIRLRGEEKQIENLVRRFHQLQNRKKLHAKQIEFSFQSLKLTSPQLGKILIPRFSLVVSENAVVVKSYQKSLVIKYYLVAFALVCFVILLVVFLIFSVKAE